LLEYFCYHRAGKLFIKQTWHPVDALGVFAATVLMNVDTP